MLLLYHLAFCPSYITILQTTCSPAKNFLQTDRLNSFNQNMLPEMSAMLSQAAEHLQSFIADCDRRTELAKKRLAETQDEISAEVAAKVMSALFGFSNVLLEKQQV